MTTVPPARPFIDAEDVRSLVAGSGARFDQRKADAAIEVADGWLRVATELAPWPTPADVDPALRSLAIELAALAYVASPVQVIRRDVGDLVTMWAPDALARRQSILDAARARFRRAGMPSAVLPAGPSPAWPDAARPAYGAGWSSAGRDQWI